MSASFHPVCYYYDSYRPQWTTFPLSNFDDVVAHNSSLHTRTSNQGGL